MKLLYIYFFVCSGLARNCNAPVNIKVGAEAKDWKAGKPVRVVRNCKLAKHSKYAPVEGNRYDGIYKVGYICDTSFNPISLIFTFTSVHVAVG